MPIFGSTSGETTGNSIIDTIRGTLFTLNESAAPQSISGYYYGYSGNTVRFAIFSSSGNLIAQSESFESSQTGAAWHTSSFSSTPPDLSSGQYYLAALSDASNLMDIVVGTGDSHEIQSYTADSSVNFPNTFTSTASDPTYHVAMYCTYSTELGTDVTTLPDTTESLNQSFAPDISIAEDLTLTVNTAESQIVSLDPAVTIAKIVFPETAESETITLQPNIELATDGIVNAETAESITETLVSNLALETDKTVITNTAESVTETLPASVTGNVDLGVWTSFSISQAYDPVVSSTIPLDVDSIAYIDQTIPLYNASKERLEYQDLSEGGYTAGGNYQKDEIEVKRVWKIDLQYLRSSEYTEITDYLRNNLFGQTDFWLESFGGSPSMTSIDAMVSIEQDERVQFGKDGVWESAGHNLTLVVTEI
jgi:hypothetical protein